MKLQDLLNRVRSVVSGAAMVAELSNTDIGKKRYLDGLETGRASAYVSVGYNNVWSAKGKDDSHTSSYEKIGYHTGSVDFIIGALDSGCPIRVYAIGVEGFALLER